MGFSPLADLRTARLVLRSPTPADAGCLGPAHWGQGLLAEALSAVLELMRRHPDVDTVMATTDTANDRSARSLAAAGLIFTGILPAHAVHPAISPEPRDSRHYQVDVRGPASRGVAG
jgi:RimJ/RimL family protein N-acetyltransferase